MTLGELGVERLRRSKVDDGLVTQGARGAPRPWALESNAFGVAQAGCEMSGFGGLRVTHLWAIGLLDIMGAIERSFYHCGWRWAGETHWKAIGTLAVAFFTSIAAAADFRGVGYLEAQDNASRVTAVSPDGSTVIGTSEFVYNYPGFDPPVPWSDGTPRIPLDGDGNGARQRRDWQCALVRYAGRCVAWRRRHRRNSTGLEHD